MKPTVPDIASRRKAKQSRAKATVDALLEAGAYILEHEGVHAFTTNRVAEKAGVNIGSLYQYFPNKAALLFHIAQATWERQFAVLQPLLVDPAVDGAERLRRFVAEFFLIEAAEARLRRALRGAAVDLTDTPQFADLLQRGADLTRRFMIDQAPTIPDDDREFVVDFMVGLITSFAERATDLCTPPDQLKRQADLLSDMLVEHFGIGRGNR